jgi:nucleotide-binding universal stress UspA family protein
MKVLFSTDGSRGSFEAERWLAEIGNRETVNVTVLTVGDRQGRVISAGGKAARRSGWKAYAVADAGRSRVEREGFEATSMVARGDPPVEIARHAREGDFDLTLIGRRGRPLTRSSAIPTIGSLVLASSGSALLVARSRPHNRVHVLLVADESDDSQAAKTCFRNFADPRRCTATSVSLTRPPLLGEPLSSASSTGKKQSITKASQELLGAEHYGLIVCGMHVTAGVLSPEPLVQGVLSKSPGVLMAHA